MEFNDFWHKYSWYSWPSNVSSSSHVTQRLFLHYLGKTEQMKYALKWTTNVNKLEIGSHKNLMTAVWADEYIVYLLTAVLPAIKCVTATHWVTRSCFSSTAYQRIGSRSDRTVGVWNLRLHLSGSVVPNSPDLSGRLYKLWGHATAGLSDDVQECGWTQEATGWNLDWWRAEHWHCYAINEWKKMSACLCLRKGPTFQTLNIEQLDNWINCQPEWPICKPKCDLHALF